MTRVRKNWAPLSSAFFLFALSRAAETLSYKMSNCNGKALCCARLQLGVRKYFIDRPECVQGCTLWCALGYMNMRRKNCVSCLLQQENAIFTCSDLWSCQVYGSKSMVGVHGFGGGGELYTDLSRRSVTIGPSGTYSAVFVLDFGGGG